MCGSLRLERLGDKVVFGGYIQAEDLQGLPANSKSSYCFNGHARIDGSRDKARTFAQQWPKEIYHIVTIKAAAFTEKHRYTREQIPFNTKGKAIAALVDSDGNLRIITRESKTPQEKAIHDRMPVQVPPTMDIDNFKQFLNTRIGTDYSVTDSKKGE